MLLHVSIVLATLSGFGHATLPRRAWTWTSGDNHTQEFQLDHVRPGQTSKLDYFFTPSPLSPGSSISNDTWPALPFPGFWTCPRDTALPPNTEDCLHLVTDTYQTFGNVTLDIPADRCAHISYRSCIMYTCASPCAGFAWNMDEWYKLAEHLRNSCIQGRGGGGYVQRQPGGRDEAFVYRTGLAHVSKLSALLTPPIVC